MTAPQPDPIMLKLERWTELRVFDDADNQEIVLEFARPDMPENVPASLFETRLSVEDAIDLIDRLVGSVARLKGLARPPDAGPLSSTF